MPKIGEFAGMRERPVATGLRFSSAVKPVAPYREGRKVNDGFVAIRPRQQIAFWSAGYNESAGKMLFRHIRAAAKMRFHCEISGTH